MQRLGLLVKRFCMRCKRVVAVSKDNPRCPYCGGAV